MADHGEVRSGVPRALEGMGACVEMADLSVADYLMADGIGVERKSVADVHRSVASGRLWAQLLRCRESLDRTYLLVEGADLDCGAVSPAGVRGALLEIGDRGVTVLRSMNARDSALWLVRLAVRLQRSRTGSRRVARRSAKRPSGQLLLSEVPGIGPPTARRLLEQFGSVGGVATADLEDLMKVSGVGPRRAAALHEALVRTQHFHAKRESAARPRVPSSKAVSPEVSASPARIGRSRGT